jgi:hypothetical protein
MTAKNTVRLLAAAVLLACAAASASAQGAREILSTFPDSQVVMYVNSQRIFNEALPKIIPQAELDKVFADAMKGAKFDPRTVHFVALGARYTEPVSLTKPPDILVVVKGDFNADALLSMARMGLGDSTTTEDYKGRTLTLFRMKKESKTPPADAQAGAATPKPPPSPMPYEEFAFTSFDANTLVLGIPAYVRAAVDAAQGSEGRIRADLLELVTRNPDNLVSFVGDIPASTAGFLKSMGGPQNEEINRVVASLRQVQMALQMSAADFGIQTVIRTDTAENAGGLNGLVSMGLSFARTGIEGELEKVPASKPQERQMLQTVLEVVSNVRNAATSNEVQIDISVPQAKIAALVSNEIARRKAAAAKKPAPTTKRAAPRRRGRRRA